MRADRVLVNVHVVTNGARQPLATEVALRKNRILAVGTGLAPSEPSAAACVIDCGGRALVPGFVDPHLHFFALVDRLLSVDSGRAPASVRWAI